jgi:hypothetical protein
MCKGIANTTSIFDDLLVARTVGGDSDRSGRYKAPNFLRMDRRAALERARNLGSNVLCHGDVGRVVSQTPSPGVAMDENDIIRLRVAGDAQNGKRATPDLRGLPLREAKRVATRHGFKCTLVGGGVVRAQDPPAGRMTSRETVRLYCNNGGSGTGAGSSP